MKKICIDWNNVRKDMSSIVYDRNGKNNYECAENLGSKWTYTYSNFRQYIDTGKTTWKLRNTLNDSNYYIPFDEEDKTLIFNSRFEAGNLALVIKVSDTEYKLVMQNDTLTKGHNQC